MNERVTNVRDAAFRHARQGARERRSTYVAEWDATVFAAGFVSVAENNRYHRQASRADEQTGELSVNLSEVMARAVIDKLQDESGEPVFVADDLDFLLNQVPGELVSRLYGFVRGEADISPKKFRVTVV